MRRTVIGVMLLGVAVSAADSSVVVLALPHLLAQFNTSIETVSWVITAYNLVVAVTAATLAFGRVARRIDPGRAALAGGALFLLGSLGCAAAPEIWSLIALRCVQGLGAAFVLVATLPILRSLASAPERGSRLWAGAGVFGAALGPAAGGVITQLLGWRVIFVAQAPVAALLLVVALRRPLGGEAAKMPATGPRERWAWRAGAALVLVSGALVALLFLAVVEMIDIRGYSPLAAGAAATTIALAALAAAPLAGLPRARATGTLLLGAGLAGMAFLPGPGIGWPLAAFAVAGFGYGLAVPGLVQPSAGRRPTAAAGAAASIALRHAGLVGGLLLLTPLLTTDLARAGDRAELRGIATVLDSRADASTKVHLAFDLAPLLARPARTGVPDFEAATSHKSAGVAAVGRQVDSTVRATLTRGFRRSFLVAAVLALLAACLCLHRGASRGSRRLPAIAAGVAAVLLAAEFASGAAEFGTRPALAKPCAGRSPTAAGRSQRALLASLAFLACHLHETPEHLVANTARHAVAAEDFIAELRRLARIGSLIPSP